MSQKIVMSACYAVMKKRVSINVTDLDGFLQCDMETTIPVALDNTWLNVVRKELSDFRVEWVDKYEVG